MIQVNPLQTNLCTSLTPHTSTRMIINPISISSTRCSLTPHTSTRMIDNFAQNFDEQVYDYLLYAYVRLYKKYKNRNLTQKILVRNTVSYIYFYANLSGAKCSLLVRTWRQVNEFATIILLRF